MERVEHFGEEVPALLISPGSDSSLSDPPSVKGAEVAKRNVVLYIEAAADGPEGDEGLTHLLVGQLPVTPRSEVLQLVVDKPGQRDRDFRVIVIGKWGRAQPHQHIHVEVAPGVGHERIDLLDEKVVGAHREAVTLKSRPTRR